MSRPWVLDYDTENCTIGAALAIVGEKWTFLVLREAFNGVRRFDDIRRRISAPRQILSDRLARLVDAGPAAQGALPGARPAVAQRVPADRAGPRAVPADRGPAGVGQRVRGEPGRAVAELTHRDCGAPVHLELRCAEGHLVNSAREVTPVPGPGARLIA